MAFCNEHGMPHSEFLEWDGEDKAKALAYMMEKSARCTLCGTADWEWQENRFAYTPVEEFCVGCYQKSVFQDTETDKSLPGTNVRLVPTTKRFLAQQAVAAQRRFRMNKREREPQGVS